MRAVSIVWLGLLGCHRAPPASYPPIATPCTPDRIGHVAVEGAPRNALAALTVLEGTHDDPARTERIAKIATENLHARGFTSATIAITRAQSCGTDLAVAVTLGRRYTIAQIQFITDDEFPDAQRLAVIEDALGTVNTVGGTYIEDRLVRALPELRRRYEDAGWLQAKLSAPQATFEVNGTVTISIPVRPGPRFKIGNIRAIGTNATTRTTVIDALGVKPGDYFDRANIRAGIERARRTTDRWIEIQLDVASDRTEIDVDAIVEDR